MSSILQIVAAIVLFCALGVTCIPCGNGGTCRDIRSAEAAGCSFRQFLCPGDYYQQCCEYGSCTYGTCMEESQCDGVTHVGLCPGPSNIKCCQKGASGPPSGGCSTAKDSTAYEYAYSCTGGSQPGAVSLLNYLIANYGGSSWGIYNCRQIGGSSSLSIHSEGRAMDWKLNAYDSSELAAGNAGHAFLRENAAKLGLQYIIWNRKSWSPSNGYRDYNGVSPHTDHLHIELNWAGARKETSWYCENPGW